ncbi:G1 family glutamic endopeptidase [Reyranella sp.]|uniref:G1 family glutamic endopeptidase n=1 Tax=Reyranella sp. TaxID=1929291 RepID=UPI003D0C36C4
MNEPNDVPAAVAPASTGLRHRTYLWPLPPRGFDPLAATDAIRSRYGLPTLGGLSAHAAGLAFRRAFLSRPSSGRSLRFVAAFPRVPLPLVPGLQAFTAPTTPHPWPGQKSSNWSGGYVVSRSSRSLISVMGTWNVPQVSAPGGTPTHRRCHSSTWIGLDGQRHYRDSTLPQMGTAQIFDLATGRSRRPYAWYQWWARGRDEAPEKLALPVAAGDEVSALLTVLDAVTVRFNFKNVTQGIVLQAFDVAAPPDYRVSGATAEWIMERPSPMRSDGWEPYKLPAFRPFSFTDCLAESGEPRGAALVGHDLERARLIRMYGIDRASGHVRTLSTVKRSLAPVQSLDFEYVGP